MNGLEQTLEWLYSLQARGEIYKLERMVQALAVIGDPHRKIKAALHIAGTKGKGSVAALIDSCLREAGYKCGLYTKPHLVKLAERTRINGAEMPDEQLLDYIVRLRAIYERAGMELTFFEFTVAIMFLYFAESNVDVAIIETGLGGRLDSTNVVHPNLSVITPIGFDHMEQLGYEISAIAAEKGGIIKPGIAVVIGTRDSEARATLLEIAEKRKSKALMIGRDFSFRSQAPAHRFDYSGIALNLRDIEIALAGPFQHENGAIAIAALEELQSGGWNVSHDTIRRGFQQVVWPGRFDIVSRRPLTILDCAHNELSIAALLDTIAIELGPDVRPRLVFGCLQDKKYGRMAELLAPRVRDAILTSVKPKRPLDPEVLKPLFAAWSPAKVVRDPHRALEQAMEEAAPDDVILVTGSVYLIGEIYQWFLARQGRGALFPEA